MANFELVIWNDEGYRCTIYSDKLYESEMNSEADKFFNKYIIDNTRYHKEAMQLYQLINQSIASKYGAIDSFFDRHENLAQALPPLHKKNYLEISILGSSFPLRLYCLRISEQIIVLFNGGEKTAQTVQQSQQLSIKFYEAQIYSKRILADLVSNEISISKDGRYLLFNN
jgi:hypothetical protein